MTSPSSVDLTSSYTHHSLRRQAQHLKSVLLPDVSRLSADLPVRLPSAFARARLRLTLTLDGETYAIRYQAKARGYMWRDGAWHRQISTPLFNLNAMALTQGLARLSELIAAEQGIFKRGCRLHQLLVTFPVGAR